LDFFVLGFFVENLKPRFLQPLSTALDVFITHSVQARKRSRRCRKQTGACDVATNDVIKS